MLLRFFQVHIQNPHSQGSDLKNCKLSAAAETDLILQTGPGTPRAGLGGIFLFHISGYALNRRVGQVPPWKRAEDKMDVTLPLTKSCSGCGRVEAARPGQDRPAAAWCLAIGVPGAHSPLERQSCSGIPLPETSGSPLGRAAAGRGTLLLPFNVTLNWKQRSYLPPPCRPSSLQLISSALSPFGMGVTAGRAASAARGVCTGHVAVPRLQHPGEHIPNEDTERIPTRGTRGSFALLLAPSSSLSIPPSSAGGCDDNTLAEPPKSWLSACLGRDGKISPSWLQGARVTPVAVRSAFKHRANSLAAHGKLPQRLRVQQLQECFASLSLRYLRR